MKGEVAPTSSLEYNLLSAPCRKNLSREDHHGIVPRTSRTERVLYVEESDCGAHSVHRQAGTGGGRLYPDHQRSPVSERGGSRYGQRENRERDERSRRSDAAIHHREEGGIRKTVQAELRDIQAKIADLQTKTATASGEARVELQKAIKDFETKKDEARKTMDELHNSTTAAWNRFKDNMNLALERLRQVHKDSLSKLP